MSTLLDYLLSEPLDQVGDLDLDLMELPSLEGLGEEEDLFFDCSLSKTESFDHDGVTIFGGPTFSCVIFFFIIVVVVSQQNQTTY